MQFYMVLTLTMKSAVLKER